ncbi:hypothetical protein [Tuwongella immobilis]|uniref:Metalloendopeptidase-like membrane protein n=1 Tax=Tuwongella immobilis TaxID=692036 RepID=A0A6C2YIP5_9BACT|nr:hypothetical protein [Tuwongella immobilis]VIP00955.1 Metalloendopeptidase-like membrane protein OS=Singulisphaera acidiphila (strain ATCC BAA-1392 / DSM 18658 / VKM B-2454 / MOB10) GN=Sinac_6965 PE=4 SV=1 [Tuwongella immobilis]VTR97328.1 Metalloendopeptidase-like membrane protein OS=Singulisphaera acidiphila (strain ATCC BAA-1392 / DSM 18658 / VKM B-2454 / MOB10) GN=Sinac_6965 PE=4 SV=1 [Tuwongella immobilis]
MGTTAPGISPAGKPNYHGVDSREAFLAMHLNRPLLGQRVEDGQILLKHLNAQPHGVELVAIGSCGPIGLHLAALEPSVKSLTLERSILSWQWVTQTPLSQNQFTNVVPNALSHYDFGDLLAMIAPRSLTISHAVDATGRPASADAITAALSAARKRYADGNRLGKLRILP